MPGFWGPAMKIEPLFAVEMLPVSIAGFVMSVGSLRGHDLGIDYAIFGGRGSKGARRFRGIGRQDVYLRCTNNKLLEYQESGARGRKA